MALSDIALCSRALLKIGAQPVASLEEGTAEAEVAANLYPGLRDALLASFPWSFATTQATLPRLAAAPVADWLYAFQMPADLLRVLSAGSPYLGSGLAYHVLGQHLHCNAEQVTLSYIRRPDESAFPAFFAEALVARLAAEFCLPLTEDASRARLLFDLADSLLRSARNTDSQQATPRAIADFPLLNARG
jgi:hypothetical protein